MKEVMTIGVDVAKNVFPVHGVDAEPASTPSAPRSGLGRNISAIPRQNHDLTSDEYYSH